MVSTLLPVSVRNAVLDASAVLFPVRCAGCAAPERSVCSRCEQALVPEVERHSAAALPVWSSLGYDGVVRAVLLALKEGGRVDVATALAGSLRASITAAQAEAGRIGRFAGAADEAPDSALVLPVLIPSTRSARQRRGYHPTGMVLARSRILTPPLWRALRLTRQTADQAPLSSGERTANRTGSMAGSPRLRGRRCLIVDDIVTSGATIAEAARAVRAAGGEVVGASTIARTRLRDAS